VPRFRAADGTWLASVSLDELLDQADAVVVVTPHRAIDWEVVYGRARLVIDTTNSSRGHVRRAGQVLRLGAGWATPEVAQAGGDRS
jgi:UDP-N-acetyl-D-mannosaminuronate dehydrogenase